MSIEDLFLTLKAKGKGRGNWGHKGVPGQRGGSAPRGGGDESSSFQDSVSKDLRSLVGKNVILSKDGETVGEGVLNNRFNSFNVEGNMFSSNDVEGIMQRPGTRAVIEVNSYD